jgi:hypothetical protein
MNYAIKFSGDNFLEQHFQEKMATGLKNFTIQCWLKTTESGPLFLHHSQKDNSLFSVEVTKGGKINFSVRSSDFDKSIESLKGGINNGTWAFLSVSKEDDELSITINSEIVSSSPIETAFLPEQFNEGVLVGKSFDNDNNDTFFNGEIGGIAIWNKALSADEVVKSYQVPVTGNEEGLLSSHPFAIAESKQDEKLKQKGSYTELLTEKVKLKIINNSPHEFQLSKITGEAIFDGWPETIHEKSSPELILESSFPVFFTSATYAVGESSFTDLKIEIVKPQSYNSPFVTTAISADLARDISIKSSEPSEQSIDLRISENLVLVNAINLNNFLEEIVKHIDPKKVVTSMNFNAEKGEATSNTQQIVEYNQACQIFNRRIQKKPLAIIYCSSSADVKITYEAAIENNLPIRVRSGGHDHEGECSGTNTILIDLMGLNELSVSGRKFRIGGEYVKLATIGAGNRFSTLTSALAKQDVMIPHGTCASVAIPGFTMGGGWGPFTRSNGMSCESLIGAEIVLGDGTIETIACETVKVTGDGRDIYILKKNKPDLMWALKGGGGMSYGIVTRLIFKTFDLPHTLLKFELEWNLYTKPEDEWSFNSLDILTKWEEVINSKDTPNLSGTNLKINGKPLKITNNTDEVNCKPEYEDFNAETVRHNCVMYGYWKGEGDHEETIAILKAFIKEQFTDKGLKPDKETLDGIGGLGYEYTPNLGAWDRESHSNVLLMAQGNGQEGIPYPPDLDEPAPHKITSRFVRENLEDRQGAKELLESLTSNLILEGNREQGLFTYVTLGAIVGDYYRDLSKEEKKELSAFPYKDTQYTIQYQTWWNLDLVQKEKLQDSTVYTRTNRALDWMEKSRDVHIENTYGAFISFKDSSIPTSTYFAQNYDELKCIKEKYSEDPYNHFRTRKTII